MCVCDNYRDWQQWNIWTNLGDELIWSSKIPHSYDENVLNFVALYTQNQFMP